MDLNTTIADRNTERLIRAAYPPEPIAPTFAARLEAKLHEAAKTLTTTPAPVAPPRRWLALVVGGMAACVLIVWAIVSFPRPTGKDQVKSPIDPEIAPIKLANWTDDVREGMMPRRRPDAPKLATLATGDKLTTKSGQRRLVQLGDGTRLYVNEKTEVVVNGPRQLTLHAGQIYLEVAPSDVGLRFTVKAGNREMTATGTHFAVTSDALAAGVIVTQGKVAVKGVEREVAAGQAVAGGAFTISPAPRASHALEWTRELMAAAESPMVPSCQHAGGALLALDPQGQEIKLSLRKYEIDVHIEDGFARTTIDQTYFNSTWERLEGTFYFPLPADASLSRLAMYVADGNGQCKLMEGGMAERKHAADVYETIRYQRRDPALLEWLDGTTFKMRVFPLEAKQEKRIILSYTQKLSSLYGTMRYRFPGGLNMPIVREWTFSARIKSGASMNVWSPGHDDIALVTQAGDVLAGLHAKNIKPEQDVWLEMQDKNAAVDQEIPRFASFLHENQQYLMLRYRPNLPSMPERKRRDWIILFEASAQRDPLIAGTQVDIVRHLLKNAEYDDTFTLLTINTKVNSLPSPPGRGAGGEGAPPFARPDNIAEAIAHLNKTHLVGALDLAQGLSAASKLAKEAKNPHIVHIGSGIPAMGERDIGKLAALLPASAPYVGVGVGKRWNRAFMKAAAERSNGLFTQINPDETIAWRAFELLATLNTPRLLNVQVVDANEQAKTRFLMETTMLAQGEEICAVTRVDTNVTALPGKVLVKGTLDGKPYVKEMPVVNVLPGAGYLPRTWAKQEIDRMLAVDAGKHKTEITNLSKAMYVMSPFTSLLVLETDADYERFKVDKGRKDHWAMYQVPPKIPLVYEPDGNAPPKEEKKDVRKDRKPSVEEVLATLALPAAASGKIVIDMKEEFTNEFGVDLGMQSRQKLLRLENGRLGELDLGRRVETWERTGKGVEFFPPALSLMVNSPSRLRTSTTNGMLGGRTKQKEAAGLEADPNRPVSPTLGGRFGFLNEELDGKWSKELPQLMAATSRLQKDKLDPADRIQFAPVFLSPEMGWAVPNQRLGKRPPLRAFPIISDLDGGIVAGTRAGVVNGEKERKRLGATWGLLPLREQQRSLEDMTDGLSLKKREAIENYLVKLGRTPPSILKGSTPVGQPASYRYERPAFAYDRTLFTDLVQYAPGLHGTYDDLLAALEAEAEIAQPKLGVIDPVARKLIEQARTGDWSALTIPAQGPLPGYQITYNGIGQFTYTRILVSGLREQVIGDGKTIWHLYPEIGLASKRAFSRHHHDLVASFNPAFLASADEMARGCDVKAMDDRTVLITPVSLTPGLSPGGRGEELVFTMDGKLSERRIVEMPARKVLLKQIFQANGAIEWHDGEGKSLAKQTRDVAPMNAPSLVPDADELVVMSLPLRTREHINARAAKLGIDVDTDVNTIAARFISDSMLGNAYRDGGQTVARLFKDVANRRLGYFVLMNAAGSSILEKQLFTSNAKDWFSVKIDEDHPNSALATFVLQEQRELSHNDQSLIKKVPGPRDGFIQKLAHFRNLWLTWQNQRPLQNSGAELPLEKAKVLEFLQETSSPEFAYAILDTMQRRCNTAPSDHMLSLFEKRFGAISDPLGVGYVVRYEHARSLHQAGMGAEASKRFRDLHADTLKHGVVPPIDQAFRDSLQLPIGNGPRFIAHVRAALDDLLAKKRYGNAIQLSRQMEQLGDEALADDVLTTLLAKAAEEDRNLLTLLSADVFFQRKSFVQADRLLMKLLEDKKLAKHSGLWRYREEIARNSNQTATALACLEKALDLEFADLPELVNLESIRTDYRTLLTQYQKIAESAAALEHPALSPPPKGRGESMKAFLGKVIRIADRWRLIDPEASEPSMLAGKILHTMGERELAWDYWTTPIDLHPAESRPWLELAETLKAEGDLDRADRAFAQAFEAEATNPEILWKRAQNAARLGQPERARQLYRQIADGNWQERFQATVEQARGLAAP